MASQTQTLARIPGNAVEPATELLATITYETALQHALGNTPLEAYSGTTKRLVVPEQSGFSHAFIASVDAAYQKHYPLTLSPDMIWLLIAQGFAIHVRENAEELRDKFVAHKGKITLRVRRDEFVKGFAGNDWEGIFTEFSQQIQAYIGESAHQTIVPSFSTTGIVEKAAFEVSLLDTLQEYFDYDVFGICGIPYFVLEGSPNDWQSCCDRAAALAHYDLDWWITPLLKVLEEFLAASLGSPNPEFWQEFYGREGCRNGRVRCGEPYFIGHVVNFFPYFTNREPPPDSYRAKTRQEHPNWFPPPVHRNPYLGKRIGAVKKKREWSEPLSSWREIDAVEEGQFPLYNGVTNSSIPQGISIAPFLWKHLGTEFSMEFLAGFVGATQDPETLAIRPEIGWAVRERVG